MYISSKDWKNYIEKLSALDNKAGELMQEWIQKNGFGDTKALIDYAFGVATKYGEGSAALTAAMYDAIAEVSGKFYEAAEVAATPSYGEVAKTVNGTLKHSQNPNTVSNAISRLVKRTGADTMLKNADRDGAQFAWVPNGDTCAFCIALASRGWQDMSSKALKGGHAEHIHANCDCTYAVRFDKKSGVAGYDPQKYEDMYYGAEGGTPQERINSLRRMRYAERKDVINAQKRAAYAEKTIEDYAALNRPDTEVLPERTAINDNETVASILEKIDFDKGDTALKDYMAHSIRQMRSSMFSIVDENTALRVERTDGRNSFGRSPQISRNRKTYTIKINPESSVEYGFAHEFIHFSYKVMNTLEDPDYQTLVDELMTSITAVSPGEISEYEPLYYVARSALFVDPYQGRTYITYEPSRRIQALDTSSLVEYLPTGYEYYLGEPELLERVDKKLYNFFIEKGW